MSNDDGEVSVHNELDVDAAQGTSSSNGLLSYAANPPLHSESIYTVRKKELHFFSNEFLQNYQSWFQDDEDEEDNEDEEDDTDDESQAPVPASSDRAEFPGSTNFAQRRGSYRTSHEKGVLDFAKSLDIDDEDDSDEDPSMGSQ